MLNEAYGVLSDQQKRRAYDSTLEERIKFEASQSNSVEGDAVGSHMRGNGWVARDDIEESVIREAFNRAFSREGREGRRSSDEMWEEAIDFAYPGIGHMFFGSDWRRRGQKSQEAPSSSRPRTKTATAKNKPPRTNSQELQISDNDLALVAALKEAYASNESRNWRIMRDANDKRGYPTEIWRIEKRGQDVKVLRVVEDWRQNKEGGVIAPKYVDVADLSNPKYRNELKAEGINVPLEFSDYMDDLRDLAKLTPNSTEMSFVIDEINARSSRMGEYTAGTKSSRENTLRFSIFAIEEQLKNREGQIVSVKRRMMSNEGGRHFDPSERRV